MVTSFHIRVVCSSKVVLEWLPNLLALRNPKYFVLKATHIIYVSLYWCAVDLPSLNCTKLRLFYNLSEAGYSYIPLYV